MENKLTIHIDSFDGPFDLLYFLIKKNKLDINEISVTHITEQYLEYLFSAEALNMEIASEFLVMASTLLHIKSKMLLPRYEEEEAEEDEIDSREELILRLIEYKKYKDITSRFRDMADRAAFRVFKYPESIHFKKYVEPGTHNIFELWSCLENLIETININVINSREKMKSIRSRERVSITEKMKTIMSSLVKKTRFVFRDMFNRENSSRLEIVAGFIAILELSRLNRIVIKQKELFDDILISRKDKKKNDTEDK